jgi:hypothetical protein
MKRKSVIARVTIGLRARELLTLYQALDARYGAHAYSGKERGHFIRLAILAYSSAATQLGKNYHPRLLACDLRKETPFEYHYRTGEPLEQQQLALPDNVVPLFPAA